MVATQITEGSTRKPKRGVLSGSKGDRIPLPMKLQARSLYLIHGKQPKEIAEIIGLTAKQLAKLAFREGWTQQRKRIARAKEENLIAREGEAIAEVQEKAAVEAETMIFRTYSRVDESLRRDDINAARDFRAYTGGLRDLVTIARTCRGLDAQPGKLAPSGGPSINMFFFGGQLGESVACRPVDADCSVRNVTHTAESAGDGQGAARELPALADGPPGGGVPPGSGPGSQSASPS